MFYRGPPPLPDVTKQSRIKQISGALLIAQQWCKTRPITIACLCYLLYKLAKLVL